MSRMFKTVAAGIAVWSAVASSHSAPTWWSGSSISTGTLHNTSPATIGQAMYCVQKAKEEFDATFALAGGAGSEIDALLTGYQSTDNGKTLLNGQLKYLAAPFYHRLHALEVDLSDVVVSGEFYPWSHNARDDADDELATIGQMKQVFSFETRADENGNSVPDWQEIWSSYSHLWVDSENGADSNDGGSATAAFGTVQKAKSEAEQVNGPVKIHLIGEFTLGSQLLFDASSNDQVWIGEGGRSRIRAGHSIGGWQETTDGAGNTIFSAPWSSSLRWLAVNGQWAVPARTPNLGSPLLSMTGAKDVSLEPFDLADPGPQQNGMILMQADGADLDTALPGDVVYFRAQWVEEKAVIHDLEPSSGSPRLVDGPKQKAGSLVFGASYRILDLGIGGDFMSAGASVNQVGHEFIANGGDVTWGSPAAMVRRTNIQIEPGQATLEWKTNFRPSGYLQWSKYYIDGRSSGITHLDSAGEFWWDEQSGMVYYYPRPGETVASVNALAIDVKKPISIVGSKYLRFENIEFFGGDWEHEVSGWEFNNSKSGLRSTRDYSYGIVDVAASREVHFSNCVFTKGVLYGLTFSSNCVRCSVTHSEVYECSAGVRNGWIHDGSKMPSPSDRRTVAVDISHNRIHDLGAMYFHGFGVLVGSSSHAKVKGNEIYNAHTTAIESYAYFTSIQDDHIDHPSIVENYIHDIDTEELIDVAGIHTSGLQTGGEILRNRIEGFYSRGSLERLFGIYLDQTSSGLRIEENVVKDLRHLGSGLSYGTAPLKYNGEGFGNVFIGNVCEGDPGPSSVNDGFELIDFKTDGATRFQAAEVDPVGDAINGTVASGSTVFFYSGRNGSDELPQPLQEGVPVRANDNNNGSFSLETMTGSQIDLTSSGTGSHTYSSVGPLLSFEYLGNSLIKSSGNVVNFQGVSYALKFVGNGQPPEPLQLGTLYYGVQESDLGGGSYQYKLAEYPNGPPITLTGSGSGSPRLLRFWGNRSYFRQEGSVFKLEGHGFKNGDPVLFVGPSQGGQNPPMLPSPLQEKKSYFAVEVSATDDDEDTFRVALTPGGTPIELTSSVSGLAVVYRYQTTQRFLTVDDSTDKVLCDSHGYRDGAPVMFQELGVLPSPIQTGTEYYVRNADGGGFQLSETPSGPLVDITDTGDGLNRILPYEVAFVGNYLLGHGSALAVHTPSDIDYLRVISNHNRWYRTTSGAPIIRGDRGLNRSFDNWKANGEDVDTVVLSVAGGFDIEAEAKTHGGIFVP